MTKNEILKILESAKDKNGDVPMRLVRQALEKLPIECEDDKHCSNCMYSVRPTYKSPCSECRDNSQWEMKPISRRHENGTECEDTISRQKAIEAVEHITSSMSVCVNTDECHGMKRMQRRAVIELANLPSAQLEYEPVKAEDFAKTMSENTLYGFMVWHGEALELMERQGFVICKKTL